MATKKAMEVIENENKGLMVYDEEDAGAGFEGQTTDDVAVPFLSLLQALSPQVTDGNPPEARPGMLCNTVTSELFDGKDGLLFVPSATQHFFVEWVPRAKGGGFVARHEPTSEIVALARQKAKDPKFGPFFTYDESGKPDNQLIDTFYLFGVMVGTDPAEASELTPMIVAFSSTKIKVYRGWNSLVSKATFQAKDGTKRQVPMCAHLVRIGSKTEENAKGKFHNFTLRNIDRLPPTDPRYRKAKELHADVLAGRARAAEESQESSGSSTDATGENPPF